MVASCCVAVAMSRCMGTVAVSDRYILDEQPWTLGGSCSRQIDHRASWLLVILDDAEASERIAFFCLRVLMTRSPRRENKRERKVVITYTDGIGGPPYVLYCLAIRLGPRITGRPSEEDEIFSSERLTWPSSRCATLPYSALSLTAPCVVIAVAINPCIAHLDIRRLVPTSTKSTSK